jgi:VanZ family protein
MADRRSVGGSLAAAMTSIEPGIDPGHGDRLTLAARVVFILALIFTVVMALLPHPPTLEFDDFGDKFHHILAFATLSLLASLAFPAARLPRIGERLSFLGAIIEVLQSIPALHRDCDIRDWIADTIAIAVVLVIVAAFRRWRRRQPASAIGRPGER